MSQRITVQIKSVYGEEKPLTERPSGFRLPSECTEMHPSERFMTIIALTVGLIVVTLYFLTGEP